LFVTEVPVVRGQGDEEGPYLDTEEQFFSHPLQNPVPVDDIRKNIASMLSNPKCSKFVSDLINGAAANSPFSNPAESTDPLKLFDIIKGQNGFVYDRIMSEGRDVNTVRGAITMNNAQVVLHPNNAIGLRFPINAFNTALTTLHEIIHLAGKNTYSDQALADVVSKMPGSSPPTGDITKTTPASDYWNKALRAACFPANVR
jgi:hypothetical protein